MSLALYAYRGDTNAERALRDAGPNTVLELTRLLDYREPALRKVLLSPNYRLPSWAHNWTVRFLGPSAEEVQLAAARGLGTIGVTASNSIPRLAEILEGSNQGLKIEAAHALSSIGRLAVPSLRKTMNEADIPARWTAAYALGRIGPAAQASVPELIRGMAAGDENLRRSAGYALTLVGPEGVVALRSLMDKGNTNNITRGAARDAMMANPAAFQQERQTFETSQR